MTREVVDCDKCGAKDIKGGRVAIHTGWTFGGPGGGEKEYRTADLCPKCLTLALEKVIEQQCSADYRVILADELNPKHN